MSSPCPPRTNECTFSTDTLSSAATNVLIRAESSTPAMPITRFFGNPLILKAACAMASSGFVTTIRIAFGRKLHDRFHDALHHVVIRFQKIVAAHSGLARESCGDHDDVAIRGFACSRRTAVEIPDGVRIGAQDRRGFGHVERFACGRSSRISVSTTSARSASECAAPSWNRQILRQPPSLSSRH